MAMAMAPVSFFRPLLPIPTMAISKTNVFSRRPLLLAPLTLSPLFPHSIARASPSEDEEEERVVRLFENATASVVSIQDLEIPGPSGPTQEDARLEGTGSGFVWGKFGHIVTNYHVVAKLATDTTGRQQSKLTLLGTDGRFTTYDARIIGIDPSHDLAVLKIDVLADLIQPATLGTSKDLRVGQSCYAIGNPYGYEHTLTTGVISGLNRQIPSPTQSYILGAIQTDAAINAGNSGGPLLDSFGRVIGVNTATFTRRGSGMSSGVNFALPIDLVYQIIPRLIIDGIISPQFS